MMRRSVTQDKTSLGERRVVHYNSLAVPRMSQIGTAGRVDERETAIINVHETDKSRKEPSMDGYV